MATASTHLAPHLGAPRRRPITLEPGSWSRRLVGRSRHERLDRRDSLSSPSQLVVRPLGLPDVHR